MARGRTTGLVRLAVLALMCVPVIARGADKPEETDKVSNDRPDRPLQMPPASSEVKEAFDDFERFRRRGAWERALKSLYSIPEDQAARFVDGENGFIIPVARRRRDVLAGLPPEGLVAYRLLHDDDAKKLLDEADGPTERTKLERVYSAYFPTSVGDNAADRLGDLYYEMGRFDRAADCWLAVLHERPDTDLSPALIAVKAAYALARAGRTAELGALGREVEDRYARETVSLGGTTATAAEHLQRLAEQQKRSGEPTANSESQAASDGGAADLPRETAAAWQMRFGATVTAGMSEAELAQWESNPLSGAVPALAVQGKRLYANFLGYVFALDLNSGKLLWRSGAFHNVEVPASQDQARMVAPQRFAIVASESHVWTLSRDLVDQNQMAPFRLTCRRADSGDVVWQSTELPDYAQLDLVGNPVLGGSTLFMAAKTLTNPQQGGGQMHQYVLAIRASDGKLAWKAEVGTFRQNQRFFYYGMPDSSPQPSLFHHAGSVYLDTHVGILVRLDAESGDVDWGYGYQTDPVEPGRFFFFMMSMSEETSSRSAPVRQGEALVGKGLKSERIYALDPERAKVLWDRPIAKTARLLGADGPKVFLGGPELSALELESKKLAWATRLPGGSLDARVLVRPNALWQLTSRGVFEIDPQSGRVRTIFRGEDTGSDGGDLYLSGRFLLAVSNRTIAAYPLAAAVADGGKGPAAPISRDSDD